MKRILMTLVAMAMLLSLCSCNNEFTFRESRFGDSMQQVIQAEGDEGEADASHDDDQSLHYEREVYGGYKGYLDYYFKDDELSLIICSIYEDKEYVEDVYKKLYKDISKGYGRPAKEEALEYKWYQALWKNDRYGIFLLVFDRHVLIINSSNPDKAQGFYNTFNYTDLYADTVSNPETSRYVDGPDFYNDPYEIESFIPVPKEGYEYTVRDSINEEELSVLKNRPTMQQLITVFGYPPMAEIFQDRVIQNDETKYMKAYRLFYFVDDKKLGVVYDEDCNLIKVSYDKSLAAIPDKNNENFEKPIGIVRNDITRDELAFIDEETTPEELQSILGAPHRECYNAQYFRRAGIDNIRFLMSRHFMYPLQDGGVLDVRYSRGNSGVLQVRFADIYEVNGEARELVEYEF